MRNSSKTFYQSFVNGLVDLFGEESDIMFDDIKAAKKTIDDKISDSYKSLKEASILINELQSDLKERADKVKELKEEYERYTSLSDAELEKLKPLLLEVESAISKGKNKERVVSLIINFIAGIILFVLGIWLGPKIAHLFEEKKINSPNEIHQPK